MKKKHILMLWLVGMVLMASCGNGETMEANGRNSDVIYSEETAGTAGESRDEEASEITGETVAVDGLENFKGDTEAGSDPDTQEEREVAKQSLENLLKTALLPVGSTMYIWGGGWNEEDTGAGVGATTLGVLPQWAEFAAQQDSHYNYKEHKYEIRNGLDCSGYTGWVVYNVFEEENGKEGYVFKSTETAEKYSELGWGELLENPSEFLPGDIVSMKGHVWISLGMCEDGSVVLAHASPPGVSVCGTPADAAKVQGSAQDAGADAVNGDGGSDNVSQAVALAEKYMIAYYPAWQGKYPNRTVKASYTENVTVLRWNTETFADAEKWQILTPEEVLKRLFEN